MANRNETDLKKKVPLKQKQKSPKTMPPVAKNEKVDSNTEIENSSVDFVMLNCLEESISAYNTGDESEQESNFSSDQRRM